MNFKFQAKILLLLAVILTAALALTAQTRQVELSLAPNQALLKNNSDLGFDVNYSVGELKIMEVQTKEGVFDELSIEGWGFSTAVGEPKLPMLRRIIAVPLGAEVRLTPNAQQMRELDSKASTLKNRVIPAQESISKSADPATIPFVVNETLYRQNEFNTREWVEVSELGIMRGVRVFALDFYPVRYNPFTNSIQVMENLDVRIDFINPDLGATADLLARTASWEFDRLYANTLFNWDTGTRTVLVRQPTKMVILCPINYINNANLQNYVTWKKQQGIAVSVVSVGSNGNVANNSTDIKNYMQGLWNNATPQDPAPTYLLIIGDESGSNSIVSNTGASSTSHVTDLTYVRLQGNDFLPEMYHGRFSVSSANELGYIINKTITYEKTLMSDLSYLGKTVLIAGVDTNLAPIYSNGAVNYASTEYFNAAHGITSNTYLYPDSESRATDIRANANEGRGYMVYTAHGSPTSWHNPSFTVDHVSAMTNSGKYGVMVGNCCQTNTFDYSPSPCFGEAVIRKNNGGGVAYIGGTNNTYWDEDYYWAVGYKTNINGSAPAYDATKLGAYDAMFHTHGESYDKWATTIGEIVYAGNLAVMQSNSSHKDYYWEIYHIMGDPSLMPYLGVPTANPATYDTPICIGNTSYAITGAAPYTRVGLSMNGVIYGSGMTDASGNANLTITPFTSTGTAQLVLTAQNRTTRIEDIPVQQNPGPCILVTAVAYDDANNDIPEYNEYGCLDVTFKNVGAQTATNVSAVLSCSTPGVTVTNANHTIDNLAGGASVFADDAFAITIADNVAHGTVAYFTITMTMSGQQTWTHSFTLTLNAPVLAFGAMTISDPTGNNNGILDPGETVTLTIRLHNNGGAVSPTGTATLSCSNAGITVNNGSADFGSIAVGGNTSLSFTLTAAASMDIGTVISLNFAATAGQYSAAATGSEVVGAATIGTGIGSTGTTTACPINISYRSLHGQSVYTKAELNAAGVIGPLYITQIGLNITGLPEYALPNFLIRIGHTTAANASNWISTGLTHAWSNYSYQPTEPGWNMFTLCTPFLWNGVDNIVVDTVFGLQNPANSTVPVSSTGTVQYTSVTNGYRYRRDNNSNMTNYFFGGSTSNYRPNLKLAWGNPVASVDKSSLSAYLQVDTQGTDSFIITNNGNLPLTFDIEMEEVGAKFGKGPQMATGQEKSIAGSTITSTGGHLTANKASGPDKSIAGSTIVLNTTNYLPDTTVNWIFTVTNGSPDEESLQEVIITFPAGVTVNSVTNFVGGSAGELIPNLSTGNGVTITWYGEDLYEYGVINGGESATATVNVTIDASFNGNLTLPWTINGDMWIEDEDPPHTLSGSVVLTAGVFPVSWLRVQPLSGTIAPGQSTTITANFSAVGMAVGTYQAQLTVRSNDPANSSQNLDATMVVWAPTVPVELSHFSATVNAENYVQLTWISQTESNLLGYNVYRNDDADLSAARRISELIEGTNTSTAHTYIYVDEELDQDGTYYYWLQSVNLDGTVGFHGPASVVFSTGGGTVAPPIPLVTMLENAYPNPFNPDTTIRYQLNEPAKVEIDIYNLKGQRVRSFVQSHDAPGYYKINWDGCDSSGRALSSGVYLYKMSAGSYRAAKKLVLKK